MFKRIGLALAFSPTCKALLMEAVRLKRLYSSELLLIHVGERNEKSLVYMNELIQFAKLEIDEYKLVWQVGEPAATIIKICKNEGIDLLIAGALKHENLFNYYLGSIALKILRKAPCSVLILTEPSMTDSSFNTIVIDAEDSPLLPIVMETGVDFGRVNKAKHLFFVREIKLYGLAMSMQSEYTQSEISDQRKKALVQENKKVANILTDMDFGDSAHHIKIIAGKAGYELRKYAQHVDADLLVLGSEKKKLDFMDRLFTNTLEYIFEDIPCNLFIIKSNN